MNSYRWTNRRETLGKLYRKAVSHLEKWAVKLEKADISNFCFLVFYDLWLYCFIFHIFHVSNAAIHPSPSSLHRFVVCANTAVIIDASARINERREFSYDLQYWMISDVILLPLVRAYVKMIKFSLLLILCSYVCKRCTWMACCHFCHCICCGTDSFPIELTVKR